MKISKEKWNILEQLTEGKKLKIETHSESLEYTLRQTLMGRKLIYRTYCIKSPYPDCDICTFTIYECE